MIHISRYASFTVFHIQVVLGHSFEIGDQRFEEIKKILDEQFKILTSPSVTLVISYSWMRFLPIIRRGYVRAWANRNELIGWMTKELDDLKKNLDPEAEATSFAGKFT